jgi:hypothetical protein
MRTTLTLDEDVASKLKTDVRKTGRSFKEVVNYYLRLGLNVRKQKPGEKPFVVRAKAMGIREGLNYDNIGELLEQIEGISHK